MSPTVPNGWIPLGPSCVINGQVGYDHDGTAPVAGRTTAIALHPDHPDIDIFIGTAMGGVWRSTDGGQNWVPQTDNQPSLAVGAMAFSTAPPPASRKLYVAAGEGNDGGEVFFGSGVLVFDDKPSTWTLLSDPLLNNMRVTAIAVETLAAGDHILVGGSNGLLESLNGGAHWSRVTVDSTNPGAGVTSIVLDSQTDPTRTQLYVALFGDGIYNRTGASGNIFARLSSTGPQALPAKGNGITRITLAMAASDHQTLYAVYAAFISNSEQILGIFRTSDGGATWQTAHTPDKPLKQTRYNVALAVHPTVPSTVIFGEARLWRSTTAANFWEVISEPHGDSPGIHADQHGAVFHPTDPTKLWAINDGGVWFSGDGGTTWHHRNRGLQTMQYYSLAQHPTFPSLMLAGAQDNGVQRFEGHPAWNLVNFGDGFFCAIDPSDPKYWYSSYVFFNTASNKVEAIFRSDKSGAAESWDRITDGISSADTTGGTPFYVPFIIDPSQSSVLYLGTTKLYRTENRGDQWTAIKKTDGTVFSTGNQLANVITAIAVSPSDSNTVYAGTADGQLVHLQRGGDGKYTANARTLPTAKYVSDIAVPAGTPSNKVYVAIGSDHLPGGPDPQFGNGRIFRSDDNGANWVNLGGPTMNLTIGGVNVDHRSNSVNAIALDSANPKTVYIGCNVGIFKSVDEGATWSAFNENLPNVATGDLQFHAGSRLLRAATIGRSIWERAVDAPAGGTGVDIFVRDNVTDIARGATAVNVANPLDLPNRLDWFTSLDLKVDTPFLGIGSFQTPTSTVNYTPGGAIDFIGYQQLDNNLARKAATSRVYAQVINRGPNPASNVQVRTFWAAKTGDSYPNLPTDFWTAFPLADPADTSVWKPVGPARTIATIPPGEPGVVSWDWDVPRDSDDTLGLLSVITVPQDPVNETRLDVQAVATNNKHVALREVGVNPSALAVVGIVLLLAGIATFAVVEAVEH